MISYKPLLITLINKDMSKRELRQRIGASSATFAKISKGEPLSLAVIERICIELDCKIEDVVEITKD